MATRTRKRDRTPATVVDRAIEALEILSSPDSVAVAFASECAWLEARIALWSERRWRIGLIGITSSGKSTLVNALLGEELLPSKVRPSSNTLVVCRAGPRTVATVFYESGQVETVEDDVQARICSLSDEGQNPENEEMVREIQISAAHYLLPEDISLVDSPGLDAFGLTRHEDITIKLLLPTVDLVLFVTTAKANGDKKIAEYLETIAENQKPLVLVQNMMDTVEAKLGDGGAEEKSKAVVAKEHEDRLLKLTQAVIRPLACRAIVQVSAREALAGLREKSNVPELARVLEREVARLSPRLERGRRQQLLVCLDRMTSTLRPGRSTEERQRTAALELKALAGERKFLKDSEARLRIGLEDAVANAHRLGDSLLKKVLRLDAEDVAEARSAKEAIECWRGELFGEAQVLLAAAQKETHELADRLNLRPQDYLFSPPRMGPTSKALRLKIEKKTHTVQRPTKGAWGTVSRFFGVLPVSVLDRSIRCSITAAAASTPS